MKRIKRTQHIGSIALILIVPLFLASCQGRKSDQPPIHLNPNMDHQPKYKPQIASDFFADGRGMRTPPTGTIAQGDLRVDHAFYSGRNVDSSLVKTMPIAITPEVLQRGQQRYNIYCTPCHSSTGDGKGIVIARGFLPPPSLHDPRLRAVEDGHFFDVMTNGIRNMPSYRNQVNPADRWAITAYIRALQRSQNASLNDVPEDKRAEIK